jgi:hypothetical protein
MKTITGYLLGAVAMALVGAVCLGIGLLNRDMADAQKQVASAEYDKPLQTYQGAERYYTYASRLPWIGNGPLNDVRAREAALHYWQKRYVAIVPEVSDPIANTPADNVDLQFVVANAVYREGLSHAKDRPTTIGALDLAISAYASLLRNARRHDDAAYNYEYLVKLRADLGKGRRKMPPPELNGPDGRRGGAPPEADAAQHKLYVPLESEEIDKNSDKAGKQAPLRKKG